MHQEPVRYTTLSRREFLVGSIAVAATAHGSVRDVARAQPAPVPTPVPPPTPPIILRGQSGAGVDSISIGWSDVGSCASLVEVSGIFTSASETRVIENALSGLTVQDLPSRSLYRVRVKKICDQGESDWSAAIELCTGIPTPTGLSVEMLPAGGAANVVWELQFRRQVLNLDTLAVRIVRSRGGATTLVYETAVGVLSGRLQDPTFGPGDSYKAIAFGVDLADSTQMMVSPPSAEVLPLLTVSRLPKRQIPESMSWLGTLGSPRWNGM